MSWCLAGCLWCITIVGIPIGMQCFKFASLSFFPFGKEGTIRRRSGFTAGKYHLADRPPDWPLAAEHAILGCALCVTIIGIPFGLQHFKLAQLALMPFGAEVY